MLKTLLLALILFSISGCCTKIYPPQIKVLKTIEPIQVVEDTISGDEINKVKLLRQYVDYYEDQIEKYNEDFTDSTN